MGIVIVVDASERYTHPRNAALLKRLKKTAVKGKGDVYDLDGYELHTHPDLCELLQTLYVHCYAGAYGVAVLANRSIIFALAWGTSTLAFNLPEPERGEAFAASGSSFPDGGDDWVGVPAWSTDKDLLAKWCRAAHKYANSIKD